MNQLNKKCGYGRLSYRREYTICDCPDIIKNISKSKTFQKGDNCTSEIMDFVMSNIETHDWQPEGIVSYADGLVPEDPRQDLKFKYRITITKIIER